MNTTNKIALVTGGSRGIGRNAALALAKKGIDVVLTYNTNKEAADKSGGRNSIAWTKQLCFSIRYQ